MKAYLDPSKLLRFRFQNPSMVEDVDLKFDMLIVFEKLEDHMHDFLSRSVHK
jgi:hypothetical protein